LEIIITKRARDDLYEFFYNSKRATSDYILKYINNIINFSESILKQSPYIGKAVYSYNQYLFRQLLYRKHKIIYIKIKNKIYILRFIYSARNFNLKKNLNLKNYPEI